MTTTPSEPARTLTPGLGAGPVRKMILLADPSEHTRYRISRILQREGHRVTVAANADDAKAAAAMLSVDLLLADIDLPGVAGGGLVPLVRHSSGRRPAAIALAAKASPRAGTIEAEGFSACVSKPVAEAELKAAVARALEGPDDTRRCA